MSCLLQSKRIRWAVSKRGSVKKSNEKTNIDRWEIGRKLFWIYPSSWVCKTDWFRFELSWISLISLPSGPTFEPTMDFMELALCLICCAQHNTVQYRYNNQQIEAQAKTGKEGKSRGASELTEGRKNNSKCPEQNSQLFRRAAFVPELISFVQTVPFPIPWSIFRADWIESGMEGMKETGETTDLLFFRLFFLLFCSCFGFVLFSSLDDLPNTLTNLAGCLF